MQVTTVALNLLRLGLGCEPPGFLFLASFALLLSSTLLK
jgi:hypothetical protein